MTANWLKKIGKYIIKSFLGKPERRRPRRSKKTRKKPVLRRKPRARKRKIAKSPGFRKRLSGKRKTKKPAKRPSRRISRPSLRKAGKKERVPKEIYVGRVTHYFPKVNACAVQVEKREFKVGDEIRIKGASTDLKMKVRSLQISLIPVDSGRPGEEVGLEVPDRVRENDEVYLSPEK